MKKLTLSILFSTLFTLYINAQTNDFGIWSSLKLSTKLNKKQSLFFENGARSNNNSSIIKNLYLQTDYSYKLSKYVKLSSSYRISRRNKYDSRPKTEHRGDLNLKITKKISNKFSISDRGRGQMKFKSYHSSEYGKLPIAYFRNKMSVDYKFSKKIKSYISMEVFIPTSSNELNFIDKERYYIGSKIKVTKQNEMKIYCLLEKNKFYPQNNCIIGVEYEIEIK